MAFEGRWLTYDFAWVDINNKILVSVVFKPPVCGIFRVSSKLFSDFILDITQHAATNDIVNFFIAGDLKLTNVIWLQFPSVIQKNKQKISDIFLRQVMPESCTKRHKLDHSLDLVFAKSDFLTCIVVYPSEGLCDNFYITSDVLAPWSFSLCRRPIKRTSINETTDFEDCLVLSQSFFCFYHIWKTLLSIFR